MKTGSKPGADKLGPYQRKRDFSRTPEPGASGAEQAKALTRTEADADAEAETSASGNNNANADADAATPTRLFVVQKHAATRLHYDFRLELDGVLVSWAVPKGPSYDPADKRMAVHVEDHPLAYAGFEGTIPPKQYGAGAVIVWDRGTWEPVGDPRQGLAAGKLVFRLHGEKLAGLWELVRIRKPDDRQDPWLLFKKKDGWAQPTSAYDVVSACPDSVIAKPLGLLEHRVGAAAQAQSPAPTRSASVPGDLPDVLARAPRAALPARLSPQLATLARTAPGGDDWIFEIKFDGYRVMTRVEEGKARLVTRGGHDWTAKMPALAAALARLPVRSGWLDGEIVVLDERGLPDFNALQNAFDASRTERIRCFLFDVPFLDGHDLRKLPLRERRRLLRERIGADPDERVRFSDDFAAPAQEVVQTACRLGLEGVIAKRADAPYVSGRTETWLKLKCGQRQEFVIGGYTERSGGSAEVGSLLLGVHDDAGQLVYAGNVGTGWDARTAGELRTRLAGLEVPASPFQVGTPGVPGRWTRRRDATEHWVQPTLVAEIAFTEWTPDGSVRHASFRGLRDDKPARQVRRETPLDPGAAPRAPANAAPRPDADADADAAPAGEPSRRRAAPPAARSGGTRVSNPDRVIDPSTGLKKLDLVRYYESVAERMLPHLIGRPVSLVRGPTGIGGELFFQKHGDKLGIPGIRELDPALWPGHQALLEIASAEALVGAAQMNAIELHTWNSVARRIDRPDRVIFDLDPGEGVTWSQVQEAALLTRTILTELGLEAWLKTSGGKGLHVVVPLAARLDYERVSAFSKAVVQHLAKTIPSRFVAKSGAGNRHGKIFVDYLRNGHGATTAAAFSARARPGLGVSMPVSWEQLASLKSGAQWTIATAREYLSFEPRDPWADYFTTRQTLTAAIKRLDVAPASPRRRATA